MLSTLPPPRFLTLEALRSRARAGAFELPVLPETVTEVLRLTHDPATTAKKLAATVERDPALAAHVLRIVNSPLHRSPMPIRSAEQAIVRIGFAEIRSMALTVACKTRVFAVKGFEADVRRSFRHSLATALFAAELTRGGVMGREEAFLTGLLHDVGEPILLQLAVDLAKQHGETVPRAALLSEVHALHAEVGARLLRLWKLSDLAADLTLLHHAPEAAPPQLAPSARLIALADELADVALSATGEGLPALASAHAAPLGLWSRELEVLGMKIPAIRATVDAVA